MIILDIIKNKKILLSLSGDNQTQFFKSLDDFDKANLILGINPYLQKNLLYCIDDNDLIKVLIILDPDQITDLLHLLDSARRQRILDMLQKELKDKVSYLLRFSPKSAAGIMSLNYSTIELGSSISKAQVLIRKHQSLTGKLPVLLVTENNKLVGEFDITTLANQSVETISKDNIRRIYRINYDASKDDVLHLFRHRIHQKIVVCDKDIVLGIIYATDVLPLINETNDNIYGFAGVKSEEGSLDNFTVKVKYRYFWLIVNLATAFLAAFVVSLFESTIAKTVVLAAYMPIIAGMGGNAATQTMAVTVRGIALREIEYTNIRRLILQELIAGFINGLINGIIVGLVAIIFNMSYMLGVVVFLSMIINLCVAGLAGSIIPYLTKILGKDPATVSTVFITTFTDVCGFFALLGLASILL